MGMRRLEGDAVKPRQIAVGVVIIGLSGLIYGASIPLKRSGKTWNCQANLKQIGLGMMQYTRDYDEHYPRAKDWATVLRPYSVGRSNRGDDSAFEAIFRCPATDGFYALNVYYTQISMAQDLSPRTAPLIFDFPNGVLNQSDDGAGWPNPPIHTTLQTTGNNVLFGDAHVELRGNKPVFRPFAPLPKPAATPTPKPRAKTKTQGKS